MGERRSVYRVLVRETEGKRPLWRPRRKRLGFIKLHLGCVGCGGMDWIQLGQDRE